MTEKNMNSCRAELAISIIFEKERTAGSQSTIQSEIVSRSGLLYMPWILAGLLITLDGLPRVDKAIANVPVSHCARRFWELDNIRRILWISQRRHGERCPRKGGRQAMAVMMPTGAMAKTKKSTHVVLSLRYWMINSSLKKATRGPILVAICW
jgi:hypothetical protein